MQVFERFEVRAHELGEVAPMVGWTVTLADAKRLGSERSESFVAIQRVAWNTVTGVEYGTWVKKMGTGEWVAVDEFTRELESKGRVK